MEIQWSGGSDSILVGLLPEHHGNNKWNNKNSVRDIPGLVPLFASNKRRDV